MQNAGTASGTFLRPYSAFLEDADEGRVQSGINRLFGKAFGNRLNTGTTGR
jgi:hypothetical protein